jgi:uncharacterized protein YkwD
MVLAQTPKRPSSPHDKKRHGHHHKHTKHYEKTYWPYLPMLLIVVVGLIGNVWLSHHQQVLGVRGTISAATLLQDTNAVRQKNHDQPLAINSQLASAANAKANDMVTRDYWSHTAPDGKTPWNFVQQSGYPYQRVGENLAYGFADSDSAIDAWMNSAEHRANLLDNQYQNVGFGIATTQNYQGRGPQTVVVALYGEPKTSEAAVLGAQQALPSSQHIARIQLMTNGIAPWSIALMSFIAGGCVVFFIVRHGLLMRRAFARSEAFIIHHPMLDVAVLSLGVVSFVLAQTSGFIH